MPVPYVGCNIKVLPDHQWLTAAQTAVSINPTNAPAVEMLALGSPGQVIAPEHLALMTTKYWGSGGVQLTVGFLDNPPADLQRRVLDHMNAWGTWANVTFVATAGQAQVRISRGPDGYWSYLGTDILHIDAGSATMNLQDFTMNTADSEFYRVVRHETGHTLGFPHEHLRGEIVSRIDRAKAIAFFLANDGWDAATTTAQVLTPLDNSALIKTAAADTQSIMCYGLPGSIMTDGQAVPGGTDIDPADAAFAASVYPRPGWRGFQLAPDGGASLSGGAAAVSRVPNSMELWWVGANGSIQDNYWYDGSPWNRFELASAGSASPSSGIAAVSRISNSMELWYVGANGSIQDNYWYDGSPWHSFELAPAGSASLSSGIAAVSRISNSMELWYVGANGSIQDNYWYDGSQWSQFELAPAGSASLSGGIAAVSRIPNSMELWWVGANGSIQGAFWYDGNPWTRYELAPAGSAALSGGIAAVSRIPNSMELWWVGANGSIEGAFWYDGGQWTRYQLAPDASASTGGRIRAVSRIPTSMELWWVGANGSIQDNYWYDGSSWNRFELAPAGSASSSGGVAAVSRIPNSMELWWVGANGSIEDKFWYP